MNRSIRTVAYFLPILALVYVWHYGVNVLFWDEFNFVDMFDDKVDFWKFILQPHNEHFMPLGKLEYYVIASLTGMNSKALMYFSVFILWLPYFFVIKKIKTENKLLAVTAIVLFYLAFYSPLSWENLLWGFQPPYLTAYAFGILAILSCNSFLETNKTKWLVCASACCFIASLNSSQGILSWCSILMLYLYNRKVYKKYILALIPLGFVMAFYILEGKGVASAIANNYSDGKILFYSFLKFFLTFISSCVWSSEVKYGWIIGSCLLLFISILLIKRYNRKYLFSTLVLFGILLAALVSFGRHRGGV